MKKHKQPEGMAPGIYLGMPEKKYHSDPALSHSGIVSILESLQDYWTSSPLNPAREWKDTDAKRFGKRCHTMLLEGEKAFFEQYCVAGSNYSRTKQTITSNEFALIKESCQVITGDKETAEYFKHGYPEVSIIVVDPVSGMRLRVRIDYLRTFGCVDLKRLKSISNRALGFDIISYGFDIQSYLYCYVVSIAKQLLRQGKIQVHGNFDAAWLKAFTDDDDVLFRFFAQRSTKPFIYRVFHFDDHILQEAKRLTEMGIMRYKAAIEAYGAASWPYGSPKSELFSIDKLPNRKADV